MNKYAEQLIDNDESLVEVIQPDTQKKVKKTPYTKEQISEFARKSYLKNRDKIIEKNKAYIKAKYHSDPEYRETKLKDALEQRKKDKLYIAYAKAMMKQNKISEEDLVKGSISPSGDFIKAIQ